jgi:KipI family sensor histidine kinase inhibitor
VTRVGEDAWLVPLASSRQVAAAWRELSARAGEQVRDVVPGARSILVVFRTPPGDAERSWLSAVITALEADGDLAAVGSTATRGFREHDVPVRYDGEDIDLVARHAGMSADAVASLHASVTYRVSFVGFQPGFAYLEGLPARLHTPRRSSPRTAVPRGAVAIGGEWTGIYPATTPGGWNLIGRTHLRLFDPTSERPALLAPGDMVRIVRE